ncbi:type II secretion system protein GspM [Zhongshania marina]|uniref:Type II secretion system protein M n=1 Tax=Zhongshania marina TaxID=2304603 RepID=A0A2S4HC10_9GAMM|nr:type II secretion system protein GspM [Marortus luteolus]POP51524.1 hypothetical protein C0068_16430 [Marortus luteolus]
MINLRKNLKLNLALDATTDMLRSASKAQWLMGCGCLLAMLLLNQAYSAFTEARAMYENAREEARWFAGAAPTLEKIQTSVEASQSDFQRQSLLSRVNQAATQNQIRLIRSDFREGGVQVMVEPGDVDQLFQFIFRLQSEHHIITVDASIIRTEPGMARARLALQEAR